MLAPCERGGEPFVSPEGLHVADDAAMAAMVGSHSAVTAGRPPAAGLAAALHGEATAGFVCFGAG
jgi:hypothetical protein